MLGTLKKKGFSFSASPSVSCQALTDVDRENFAHGEGKGLVGVVVKVVWKAGRTRWQSGAELQGVNAVTRRERLR